MLTNIGFFISTFTPKPYRKSTSSRHEINISFIKNATEKPKSLCDLQYISVSEIESVCYYISLSGMLNYSLIKNKALNGDDRIKTDNNLSNIFARMKNENIKNKTNITSYKGICSEAKSAFLKDIEIGNIVTAPYYFSTSESKLVAERFSSRFSDNSRLLIIQGKNGLALKHPLLEERGEKEILYNKNTSFKIIKDYRDLDNVHITELEEI